MEIKLWKEFSKRKNSTKLPSMDSAYTKTVVLKDDTSIESPVFRMSGSDFSYNYAYWNGHYYYISDIVSVTNNQIELHCTQDLLATYKSYIQSASAFVKYSTTNFNNNILDGRISNDTQVLRNSDNSTMMSEIFDGTGCYCVTCVGSNGGISSKYFLAAAQFKTLLQNTSNLQNEDNIAKLVKQFGSVFGAITSVKYLPFKIQQVGSENVTLGSWTTGVNAYTMNDTFVRYNTATITIPWVNSENARRSQETIYISLPAVSKLKLDTAKFLYDDTLKVSYFADYVSGDLMYLLSSNVSNAFEIITTNVATEIQINGYQQSTLGAGLQNFSEGTKWFNSFVDFILGDHMSYGTSGNIGTRLGTIGESFYSSGNNGGYNVNALVNISTKIIVECYSFAYTEEQANMAVKYGRPCMKVLSLSGLTGYVQTSGASIDIAGLSNDKNEINAMLDSGIYIE